MKRRKRGLWWIQGCGGEAHKKRVRKGGQEEMRQRLRGVADVDSEGMKRGKCEG